MELVDLYNRQKIKKNKVVDRWFKDICEDEYQQTVHMWFLNSKGELLIQKRSETKKRNPGKWAFTSGMVDSGETSLAGAIREIREELGIELQEEQLDFIISFKREHYFVDVWLIKLDLDISEMKLQEEEVSEIRWVPISEVTNLIQNGEFVKSIELYYDLLLKILKNSYNVDG